MENDTKSIKDLNGADYNPRTMSKQQRKALHTALEKYGDLSGIVFNVRTNQLVGGHQRVEAFKRSKNPKITIEHKYNPATSVGTIARGIVTIEGFDEPFNYREVDWELHFEESANIAANHISGEFEGKRLAELYKDIQDYDPDLAAATGIADDEADALLKSLEAETEKAIPPDSDETTLSFGMSRSDAQVIDAALVKAKGDSDIDDGAALRRIAENYLNGNQA